MAWKANPLYRQRFDILQRADEAPGPTPELWSEEMKAYLIKRLCGNDPSSELESICPDLKSQYDRDISSDEAHRMLQNMKLEGRVDFDARKESWYILEEPQEVPYRIRNLRPVVFGR